MDLNTIVVILGVATAALVVGILVNLVGYRERAREEIDTLKQQIKATQSSPPELEPDFSKVPDTVLNLPPPEPPEELIRACAGGECVLYAGTGLSVPAGLPTRGKLVTDLLDWAARWEYVEPRFAETLRENVRQGQIDLAADSLVAALRTSGNEPQLHEYLREIFLKPKAEITEAHRLLREINFSAFVTTNLDRLLEETYKGTISPDRVYTPQDSEGLLVDFAKRNPFILKLYGRLELPETVMVAPAQYADAIAGNRAFAEFNESLFVSRTFLFVGASLDSIEDYLKSINLRGLNRRHYALVAVADRTWESQAESLRRRFGIEVLPYTASENHPELAAFLNTLAERVRARMEAGLPGSTGEDPFQRRKTARLERVSLTNIGPFDELELVLQPGWNILLGDNGVGKSSILRAIALGICGRDAQPFAARWIKTGRTGARITLRTTGEKEYITEISTTSSGAEIRTLPTRLLEAEGWLALGFPPVRTMTWQRPAGAQLESGRPRPTADDLLPLVSGDPDPRIDKLKQWILNLDYWSKTEQINVGGGNGRYGRLLDAFFRIVNRLTGDLKVEFKEVDLNTREVKVVTDDGPVPIEAISQGTASMIGWIGVLMQRLYEIYDPEDKPEDQHGLVLIDEIDAHMHPQWQQSLVKSLTEVFPNLQFVATTHSPLMVSGMPVEQVFRFERDDDGKVVQVEVPADMTMGRTDQVLTSSLFGLETTLDPITQEVIEEYQKLLGKRKRDAKEEERFRELQRILEFRIPVPQETPPDRRAQELLQALLKDQVGEEYPEAREMLLDKAGELLKEVQAREAKKI